MQIESMQKINGALMIIEAVQKNGEPARKTVCGNAWCECSRIMAHLDLIKTPYFIVNNPDRQFGPTLPDQFVQEHGDELEFGNVILDTARTAGKILSVEFVKEEEEETGELKSIRIGQGWESFMIRNQLQAEDLLFFTLQGQSRFIVMMIRGHSRKAKTLAELAEEKVKGKRKLGDIVDDLEEGTAELWRAAKKHKDNAHPVLVESSDNGNDIVQDSSAIFVTCITSDDALGSYGLLSDSEMSLSAGSEGCSDMEEKCENCTEDCSDFDDMCEDCSDFEDEEFWLTAFDVNAHEWHYRELDMDGNKIPEESYRNSLNHMFAHDGGLVCFDSNKGDSIVICNSLTNLWKKMPLLDHGEKVPIVAQLVRNAERGCHRVLSDFGDGTEGNLAADCYDSETGLWSTLNSGHVYASQSALVLTVDRGSFLAKQMMFFHLNETLKAIQRLETEYLFCMNVHHDKIQTIWVLLTITLLPNLHGNVEHRHSRGD